MEVGKVINGILDNREKNGYNKAINDVCNFLIDKKICNEELGNFILENFKK